MPLRGGVYNNQIAFQIIAYLMVPRNLPVKGKTIIHTFESLGYNANDVERTLLEMHKYDYYTKTNNTEVSASRARAYKINGVTKKGTEFFESLIPQKKKTHFSNMSPSDLVELFTNIASMAVKILSEWLSK